MNGDCFLACVDQILAPTLQAGDIVVMDNLASHKVEGVRAGIDAMGAHARSCVSRDNTVQSTIPQTAMKEGRAWILV